jgi:hypothetical protein
MSPPITPRDLKRNTRETLRLEVSKYRGKTLFNTRICYTPDGSAVLRPGRDGWAMPIDRLPEIVEALRQLETEARAGLLP